MDKNETIELLEEMRNNCLLPTSTDLKRFKKSEALLRAIICVNFTYDAIDIVKEKKNGV